MGTRWYRTAAHIALAGVLTAAVAAGCGGDDDDEGEETPDATAQTSATASSGVTPSTTNTSGGTPVASVGDPIAQGPSASAGKTFTAAQAQTIVDTVPITPADLTSTWEISTDTRTDAAQAAANNPENAASIERCGQLLGRLVVLMSPDQVSRYIGGEVVSYFTNLTVYATDEGAADCGAEAAANYTANPQELAEAFGSVFVDPAAVVITPVDFPAVAQGSFAANLTGTINAGGTEVTLTILIVAFNQGNVSAVVGSAAATDPPTDDIYPLVELVTERIAQAQAAE